MTRLRSWIFSLDRIHEMPLLWLLPRFMSLILNGICRSIFGVFCLLGPGPFQVKERFGHGFRDKLHHDLVVLLLGVRRFLISALRSVHIIVSSSPNQSLFPLLRNISSSALRRHHALITIPHSEQSSMFFSPSPSVSHSTAAVACFPIWDNSARPASKSWVYFPSSHFWTILPPEHILKLSGCEACVYSSLCTRGRTSDVFPRRLRLASASCGSGTPSTQPPTGHSQCGQLLVSSVVCAVFSASSKYLACGKSRCCEAVAVMRWM